VYTRWKNLKKTAQMVDGQVGFFRPDNVRRMKVEKNASIVRQIERTKVERNDEDLYQQQRDRLEEIQREEKRVAQQQRKLQQQRRLEEEQEKELRSYDRLFTTVDRNNMTAVSDQRATADATAAEEYEDDFF
jgi:hypothetical protein